AQPRSGNLDRMAHIAVSNLAYAHPGGDELFSEVSFKLAPGRHVGLVGANGVGKTTLMRILAGELPATEGDVDIGRLRYMPQDVGADPDGRATVRELLLSAAPLRLREAGERALAAERELEDGGDPGDTGMRLGEAIGDWAELGGYELEGQWDAACRRIVRLGLEDVGPRSTLELSGGERKRLVLEVLFAGEAPVLLLDEPDNFLDVPAKRELEERIRESRKTILLISHDRELLSLATGAILTLESGGAWLHGDSYRTYPEARRERQERLGDRLEQWKREERRLYRFYKTMKQRASISDVLAKRADAAQSRWQRFLAAGPPPAPVTDQQIHVRMRGGDSARIVVALRDVRIDGLIRPFEDEIHFGEHVGLIGPNGSGKTQLMRLLAGEPVAHCGELRLGSRVSPGLFTQLNSSAKLSGRLVLDVARERGGELEPSMRALARYRLQEAANRSTGTLSGGQKARLEILCLELEGHNLLLLDEPTDNLDIDSAEALEVALETFTGTVVAVSHDRAFLRSLDRFLLLDRDGVVYAIPDPETALAALADPGDIGARRLIKRLSAARWIEGHRAHRVARRHVRGRPRTSIPSPSTRMPARQPSAVQAGPRTPTITAAVGEPEKTASSASATSNTIVVRCT
ncbi:MAG: ABC-F family ATP-binding cassette domain-containing protein, partial [Solirubrobacteraceae bacterium]